MKAKVWVLNYAVVAASFVAPSHLHAGDAEDAALDTIAQINHINWVVNTIKTYNNAIVLEEEYDKISPGRLNLNRIPDQETMERIIKMLDRLHSLRMKERDLKKWRDDFEFRRRERIKEFYVEQSSKMVGDVAQAVTSGVDIGTKVKNTAMAATRDAVGGYMAYSKLIKEIEKEADDHLFDLDTEKLNDLHAQNKELLQDQWNMIRKYNFDDSLRVSDNDINLLINCLKDDDHDRVYSRIEPMRDKFKLFTVYWYYLSCAALETGHYDVGLEACDTFFKVNRNLFRDDYMLGGVAMNKAVMMKHDDANRDELVRCLEIAWKNNSGYGDWRRDYILASLYAYVLHDRKSAEKVIRHAIASLEAQMNNLLSKEDGALIDSVIGENLWTCRRFLEELNEDSFEYDEDRLRRLCAGELTSSIEKLYYLGRMHSKQLWELMKSDVLDIEMSTKTSVGWKGLKKTIDVKFPLRWLLTGGVDVSLSLYNGPDKLCTIKEETSARIVDSGRIISATFLAVADNLDKTDRIELRFGHGEYPVTLMFASRAPYLDNLKAEAPGLLHSGALSGKLSPGRLGEDLFLYEVSFCRDVYRRDMSSKDLKQFAAGLPDSNWEEYFRKVFPNLVAYAQRIEVGRDGVEAVEFADDGTFVVKYFNDSDAAVKPRVSVFALNKFGALVDRADDVWKFKKLKPGSRDESKKFKLVSSSRVKYVDVETAK